MGSLAKSLPSWVAPAFGVGGTLLSAVGSVQAGNAARRNADFEATQDEQSAGQAQAASQRAAITQDRNAKLTASRALAVAAASGGSATDPTVLDTIGRIAGEGAYRTQLALYQGDEQARVLRTRADVARAEGADKQRAGYLTAFNTVLKGGYSFFDKYGGGKKKGGLSPSDIGGVEPYFDPAGWGGT